MKFQGKDYKLYEIYSELATSNETRKLLEDEINKQHIDCSRIAFKEYRDELVKEHIGYALESHDGKDKDDLLTQIYRIDRYGEPGEIDYSIGRIVDYNIPIKRFAEGKESNINIGEIDLLTETMDRVYMMTTRGMEHEAPLHQAVLEIVTHVNMISRKKLLNDFRDATQNNFKYYHKKDDLVPAILMYENSQSHKDLQNENPNSLIGRLIYKYHIRFFTLKPQIEKGMFNLIEE